MRCEELVSLHKAIREHCNCSGAAVVEGLCAPHRLLGNDAEIDRWVGVRRGIWRYVRGEMAPSVGSPEFD